MGKLFALGTCLLVVGCAEGGDPFADGGASNQGGNPPIVGGGGSNEGGAPSDCGNGVIDADEECDGDELGDESCTGLDYAGGELACSKSCELNTSGCLETLCGNTLIDSGEECDTKNIGSATCVAEGFAGGSLECDADTCTVDTGGCRLAFAEDFEDDDIPAAFLTGNWLLDPANYHTGFQSMRSNDIGDGGTTAMSISLAYDVPGSISFWHREQSESCCDLLHFYVDDELKLIASTDLWQSATFPIPAGFHTLEWRYTKDAGTSSGGDNVWVDDIVATSGYLD
jgi:hypothetical protein